MSGITAAKTLVGAGFEVTVLEARDRIGGRTLTDHSLGASVDLGAAWIHGPIGNPLTPLQKQFGVLGAANDLAEQDENSTQAYDYDGTPLDMAAFRVAQLKIQAEIIRQMGSQLTADLPEEIQSLQALANYCRGTIGELTAVEEKAFHYAMSISQSNWEAADPDQISWSMGDTFMDFPGGDVLLHGGGFNQITDGLAKGLDIKTAVVVNRVIYGDDGVQIRTNKGDYRADRVVITVPLGILKANQIRFVPHLPKKKQYAINRIGFGTAEKLVLLFDQFYWPKDKEHFIYFAKDGSTHFSSWNNLGIYPNLPILASYKSGSDTAEFHSWSDEETIERAMVGLQQMFGKMPHPLKFVRTQWQTDPYSQGSYSFNKVGQHREDRQELAKSVKKRLFFAGEATHSHFLGTVHGAYETGVRAAQEIIEIEKEKDSEK